MYYFIAFSVDRYLVRNQGKVLTKLSNEICPDTFVERLTAQAARENPKTVVTTIRCPDAAFEVCGLRQLVLACQSELSGETGQTTWR
jgi:hypothetical protein